MNPHLQLHPSLVHSPRQAGGNTEQVHDVTGVAVLAENHLQDTEAALGSWLSE